MKMDALIKVNNPIIPAFTLKDCLLDYFSNGGDNGCFFLQVKEGKFKIFDLYREFISIYGVMIRADEFLDYSQTLSLDDVRSWVSNKFDSRWLITPKFNFFKAPITTTVPSGIISLTEAYQLLKSNEYQEVTLKLRSIHQKDQFRKYKATSFDFVTFSGIFTRRHIKSLICRSNLIVIDIDHVEDLEKVRKILLSCQLETELLFTSPSGNGLKWVVRYPSHQDHLIFFNSLSNHLKQAYGIECDPSGKDVTRACFLAHDDNAFINPKYLENHE